MCTKFVTIYYDHFHSHTHIIFLDFGYFFFSALFTRGETFNILLMFTSFPSIHRFNRNQTKKKKAKKNCYIFLFTLKTAIIHIHTHTHNWHGTAAIAAAATTASANKQYKSKRKQVNYAHFYAFFQ